MSRNRLTILIVLIILAVLVTAFDIWPRAWAPSMPEGAEGEQVACTMDAMQCPDGTWVGRTGPNCQFVCPGQ